MGILDEGNNSTILTFSFLTDVCLVIKIYRSLTFPDTTFILNFGVLYDTPLLSYLKIYLKTFYYGIRI